jgi:uncharacterized protein (DUF427 family)
VEDCITIKSTQTDRVLAAGTHSRDVQFHEGAWYFDRHKVDMTHLVVTPRIYVCPYKGRCYWIDLDSPEQKATNVAFTYFDVKKGYEFIEGKVGFYSGRRDATVEE